MTPRPLSFLIVTPCDDGHKLCFWESVRMFERLYYSGKLPTQHRFEIQTVPGDSLVPRARNNLAYSYYTRTAFDYIFPLDSDLDFTPDDLIRLADLASLHDLDFLCGRYAIKDPGLRWCENAKPGATIDPVTGLLELATAPGGVHMISRRAITKAIETARAGAWPHWRIQYTDDQHRDERWNLYYNGVVLDLEEWPDRPLGRYLSEDWGISYLMRKLGFRIFCDTRSILLHRGEIFYPLGTRRLSREEVEAGKITQPDGSQSFIAAPVKV